MILTIDLEKESAAGLRRAARILQEAADAKSGELPAAPLERPKPAESLVFDLEPANQEPPREEKPAKNEKKDLLSDAGIQVY